MSSNNWKVNFVELKKLLDDLNKYIECRDWKNAHCISKVLQFKLTFYPLYEEERIKNSYCGGKKDK